jgi:hypothetical protein
VSTDGSGDGPEQPPWPIVDKVSTGYRPPSSGVPFPPDPGYGVPGGAEPDQPGRTRAVVVSLVLLLLVTAAVALLVVVALT